MDWLPILDASCVASQPECDKCFSNKRTNPKGTIKHCVYVLHAPYPTDPPMQTPWDDAQSDKQVLHIHTLLSHSPLCLVRPRVAWYAQSTEGYTEQTLLPITLSVSAGRTTTTLLLITFFVSSNRCISSGPGAALACASCWVLPSIRQGGWQRRHT